MTTGILGCPDLGQTRDWSGFAHLRGTGDPAPPTAARPQREGVNPRYQEDDVSRTGRKKPLLMPAAPLMKSIVAPAGSILPAAAATVSTASISPASPAGDQSKQDRIKVLMAALRYME